MVFVLSFVISTWAIVAALAGPIAVPAPFPGGIGPDGTRYKTAYKCEGESLEISCAADQTIKIIRANFGRFSIAICNKHGTTDMSVNCMSPASNRVMKKKCDGQARCAITITAEEFGDPCPNTPKYLEVHYGCVPKTSTTTKKPLPAWFLQDNSDDIWESRIPDPPEGFEPVSSSSESSGPLTPESTTVPETRIPITTPTGTTAASTTTVRHTTTRSTTSTTESELLMSDASEDSYYSTPQISIEIVDIPLEDQPHHCPPTTARNLAWNWTRSGDTAIQPCPPGTSGLARWVCGGQDDLEATEASPVSWSSSQPDMSDCRSLSMTRLETKVEGGDLENVLSASLAHHTRSEIIYGGDVESAAAIMRTLSNRIQYLLQTQGDKFYNKAQYIQEVLLNMVRAASNLLSLANRAAWEDLATSRQVKAASALMQVLEENAFLFAETTEQEEVLVESSKNILMSASIMEIGRLTNGTKLPVTDFEEPYGSLDNSITIPFTVLWEEARAGVTKTVHFSFRNIHEILGQAQVDHSNNQQSGVSRASMSINSRVISGSLGRGRAHHQLPFPHTITVSLRHLAPVQDPASILCVAWDTGLGAWTDSGCSLVTSSVEVSVCRCDTMTAFAVMLAPSPDTVPHPQVSAVPIMTLQIVTYIVAAISVLCVVLILVKFRRNIQRILYKTPCLNQEEKHACNPRTRPCLNMGLSAEKSSDHTLQSSMMQRAAPVKAEAEEMPAPGQGQDQGTLPMSGTMSPGPNMMYRTKFENGTPVMVTLNPYSNQLVDNLNKMMGPESLCYDTAMNPQLARLTATLRKRQQQQQGMMETQGQMQLVERQPGCVFQGDQRMPVAPSDVVFRAVSPHGHVYWEINPGVGKAGQPGSFEVTRGPPGLVAAGQHRAQHSTGSDDNTNSDLQNISDFSDDDSGLRAASEMSRQSSSRFSESRPLIYSGSSTSTSPGHSAASDPRGLGHDTPSSIRGQKFGPRAMTSAPIPRSPWVSTAPGYQDEVYAYAATDFTGDQQIRDIQRMPVSVKSKDYIMAKIADYTERHANQV